MSQRLRGLLRSGVRIYGIWSSLPGPASAAVAAACPGVDYLVTDLQHGGSSETDLPGICSVAAAAGVVPLVRTRSSSAADVGRALDLGAQGVFMPNVGDARHVAEVLGYCRHGPEGTRSYGQLMPGAPDPLRVIVLETRAALEDLDRILSLDGLDGVYVGPVDLALSLGHGAGPADAYMADVIAGIIETCAAAGVPVGVHTPTGAGARSYAASTEVRIINVAADTTALASALRAEADCARQA